MRVANHHFLSLLLMLFVIFCCVACKQKKPQSTGPQYGSTTNNSKTVKTYSFAVLPYQTQKMQIDDYLPFTDYLTTQLVKAEIKLDTSKDFPSFEDKIRAAKPDILLSNPWETLEAIKVGYKVIAMAGNANDFKGLIVIRIDSTIKTPQDLIGKSISYPSPTSLAACIMPQYFLFKHGIKVISEIDARYVGVHTSALMNVYLKQTSAAGTSPRGWRNFLEDHPSEAKELMIAWETPPLNNDSVMVRKDTPANIQEAVLTSLLKLHETEQGQKILKGIETNRFYAATDTDYDIVRNYIADFERNVRRVLQK